MKILYTAFNGKQNSSKLLLDEMDVSDKLYLKNSWNTSVSQLKKALSKNDYDLVISFGQAPLKSNTIKIEKVGFCNIKYKTNFDYTNMRKKLESKGYEVIISNDAGTYLCNNLFFHGLKYIKENNLKTKMIFVHIPKSNNITDINTLAKTFIEEN